MPATEDNDLQASNDNVLAKDFPRRSFLTFLAGAFAAAALPEALEGCSSGPSDLALGQMGSSVSFSSIPMTWVTRKQDGLSLGFQFVNLIADANHNLALSSGATPGSAYIAITFPPQHVIEDAFAVGTVPTYPVNARASGTSRLVFAVPASYGTPVDAGGIGTFPYTLQGVLELCSASQMVVAPNAGTAAPGATGNVRALGPEERTYESLAQARIDRAIARVDPKAAARVRRRALRAARILNPTLTPVALASGTGTPIMPASGQTSIELPFRVLISPAAQTGWVFSSTPITSPNPAGLFEDEGRSELWHARMAPLNGAGVPDPSLPGLSVRALYTRDWDVYGQTTTYGTYRGSGNSPGNGNLPEPTPSPYTNDPVDLANLVAPNREALVLQSGNMASSVNLPPLNVNRLILSPAGGTLDAWADWTSRPDITALSPAQLIAWKQKTVLGRDEYVEVVNAVTVHPGGFPGSLTVINKRCDNPADGAAGTLYSRTILTITSPLVSFVGAPNASDYNTFPFVALEITETKFATNLTPGETNFVQDPSGNPVTVGMIGTDWKGNAIKFTTALVASPAGTGSYRVAQILWNGSGETGQSYQLNGQRIAFAPPADGGGAAPGSYAPDGTSFETTSFSIVLNVPNPNVIPSPTSAQLVPMAKTIVIAIEAVRHLQSSVTGGTPSATNTYDYDQVCYAKNGFATTTSASGVVTPSSLNPNEIFLTLSTGVSLPPGTTTPPTTGTLPGPAIDFTQNPAQSGGLAAPAISANALSRSRGVMSGAVAAAGTTSASSSLYVGGLNPGDIFNGFSPQLFGFVPLTAIVQELQGLASQFMPKAITKELSNAEQFLEQVMGLYNLITNLASSSSGGQPTQIASILSQVTQDVSTYSQIAQGIVPAGGAIAGGTNFAQGAPVTNAEVQAAAWMQSAVTQAQELIQQYLTTLQGIAGDAMAVANDITGLNFDDLLGKSLPAFLGALSSFIQEVQALTGVGATPSPRSAAGAVLTYFGPVLKPIQDAVSKVNAFLNGASGALGQLQTDLALLHQGLDLAKDMSAEFTWKPVISGLEAGVGTTEYVAFIPQSNHGFSLDVQVNAHASGGHPAGVNITIRLDSFALAFGGSLPGRTGAAQNLPGGLTAAPIACGYNQTLQNADVSLVFDHMQVQMLAGQKPDVDVVFSNIYFGGDLKFVEAIKNLIPLDCLSDPPFVDVTSSGIKAGFSLGLPNIALGMFSIQNINISASLSIPFVSTGNSGITFEFNFCSIENPFVVTVAMLGGGGFFSMWMDMRGVEGIALGVQAEAQLAIDLVVASGSISIEVGIFLVYWNPGDFTGGNDPVSGQAKQPGWLIGGYLRLRGEVDVCGVVTISVELYLQITYSPTTGKCVASGFIAIDVSLFFFSISAQVPFSRQFAGSNGDPTFAQMMSPGGVDAMIDPTLTSTDPAATWDPFTEYCMAYA